MTIADFKSITRKLDGDTVIQYGNEIIEIAIHIFYDSEDNRMIFTKNREDDYTATLEDFRKICEKENVPNNCKIVLEESYGETNYFGQFKDEYENEYITVDNTDAGIVKSSFLDWDDKVSVKIKSGVVYVVEDLKEEQQ